MRALSSLAFFTVLSVAAAPRFAHAQATEEEPSNPWNDGLMPGNYIRLSGGMSSPVKAGGSFRYWDKGNTFAAAWENWDTGASGVSRVGFDINAAYSVLPLKTQLFLDNFVTPGGGAATSATAQHATVLEVTSGIRVRIPLPYIMPSVSIGLGLIDWQPGRIDYESASGPGTARQQQRVSGEFTIGGGIDKNIFDRYAVFGEALFMYGYTSYGAGFATPGGVCSNAGCDAFRNGDTKLGEIRGGLRVRIGR